MRINYFSDIHLEFGPLYAPGNDAEIIIAAGDIGIYKQGVEWLKTLDKPVIYVAGNHEFYDYEYSETLTTIRDHSAVSNVRFLENEKFIYKDVRFLGCTLWTDLFVDGESKALDISKAIYDFRKIKFGTKPIDAYKFSRLYYRSRQWLETELSEPFAGKTVVITHHAPLQGSWDESQDVLKKLAYCNDLTALLRQYSITAWIHGHVHKTIDYQVANTRILCNPRGYLGRKMVNSFDLNRTVDI